MSADLDRPLPPGKLPSEILGRLIGRYVRTDPSILIGPGVGRDAAAIKIGNRALVVKTDPITFATADSGRYLVSVNANDIACMGANPRWLLVTALLPEQSTTPRLAEDLFASLASAADELGILLVGGHTEITLGIDRTILVGQMLGDAAPDELLDPRSAQPGDRVLLCGGIAVEGTALLAIEAREHLNRLPSDVVERAGRYLIDPGISVLPAVNALRAACIVPRCLHDPTEGGLATALGELATATGLGIEVDRRRISVLPECMAVCETLGLDPLGLIASGALLAVVTAADTPKAIAAVSAVGIPATEIGVLLPAGEGNWMFSDGERQPLPVFAVDEIARFFSSTR